MTKSGRLGSKGERRGPRSDAVRRKLEVDVFMALAGLPVLGVAGLLCCASSAVVSELDMNVDGVVVGWSSLLSGGVLGEQSSSS